MELVCSFQKYHWGNLGNNSLVARLIRANSEININDNDTYAEFWMGTHPNGPSKLKISKQELVEYITLHPEVLGSRVIEEFGNQLPFLFKVLSIKQPLSIQAHPSKTFAKELFLKYPHIYKDENHKPELVIACTNFEVLCGFRPVPEIKMFLKEIKVFELLIDKSIYYKFLENDENTEDENKLLKDCFVSFMSNDESVLTDATDKLIKSLEKCNFSHQEKYLFNLVKKLNFLFPNDIGIFCIYWFNYITLLPGESLYLAPNEPHAYIQGDCIECMANSDNVIRAGLTPKFRDVKSLCKMLTYKSCEVPGILFSPIQEDDFSLLFLPPVKDFGIAKIILPKDCVYSVKKRQSASIILVFQGHGESDLMLLEFGKVIFLPANHTFTIKSQGLILFQAFCNV